MNRDRARELLPIIQAFADGGDIEWESAIAKQWNPSGEDETFTDNCKYRIKPKPREWWIAKKDIPESGRYGTRVYLTTCDHSGDDNFIKVRKVL